MPACCSKKERRPVRGGCWYLKRGLVRPDAWYCRKCREWHDGDSSPDALSPKHGFEWEKTPGQGDCFYLAVRSCVGGRRTSVRELRATVALALGPAQLEVYRVLASLDDDEFAWAASLSSRGILDSLETFRRHVRREGSRHRGDCVWADEFALRVVSELLRLTILLVDEEATPGDVYRVVHRCRQSRGRFIVLRRRDNHYEPLVDTYTGRRCWRSVVDLPPAVRFLWFGP